MCVGREMCGESGREGKGTYMEALMKKLNAFVYPSNGMDVKNMVLFPLLVSKLPIKVLVTRVWAMVSTATIDTPLALDKRIGIWLLALIFRGTDLFLCLL